MQRRWILWLVDTFRSVSLCYLHGQCLSRVPRLHVTSSGDMARKHHTQQVNSRLHDQIKSSDGGLQAFRGGQFAGAAGLYRYQLVALEHSCCEHY